MPEINKQQAYVIDGADVLPNPNGSAVGMLVEIEGKMLVVLPGPPRENQAMFTKYVLPRLKDLAGEFHVRRRLLRVIGGESAVDEIAAPIYSKYENVETSILFNRSEVEIHVAAKGASETDAQASADKVAEELIAALGENVFSTRGETMEEVVGAMLRDRSETLAIAESCTGGLIGSRITEVAGSSEYFLEGCVTYSNDAKERTLNVPHEIIEQHGAVSAECAEAMAVGMRDRAGSTHAISVTGIAGPGGGSEEKPVGTVFIGYAGPQTVRSIKIVVPGDRYLIRWRASQAALDLIRRQLRRDAHQSH
jgi:nicotinamide-nucleotide amidase